MPARDLFHTDLDLSEVFISAVRRRDGACRAPWTSEKTVERALWLPGRLHFRGRLTEQQYLDESSGEAAGRESPRKKWGLPAPELLPACSGHAGTLRS